MPFASREQSLAYHREYNRSHPKTAEQMARNRVKALARYYATRPTGEALDMVNAKRRLRPKSEEEKKRIKDHNRKLSEKYKTDPIYRARCRLQWKAWYHKTHPKPCPKVLEPFIEPPRPPSKLTEEQLAERRAYAKRFRELHPEIIRERKKKWSQSEKGKASSKASRKRCRRNNPNTKIRQLVRHRMSVVIRGKRKGGSTPDYIGCSIAELRAHLEARFKPGMSWDTHGVKGWHIDHIRPLASFVFIKADGSVDKEELRRAMHFTNLQPLWYWENESKGATFTA